MDPSPTLYPRHPQPQRGLRPPEVRRRLSQEHPVRPPHHGIQQQPPKRRHGRDGPAQCHVKLACSDPPGNHDNPRSNKPSTNTNFNRSKSLPSNQSNHILLGQQRRSLQQEHQRKQHQQQTQNEARKKDVRRRATAEVTRRSHGQLEPEERVSTNGRSARSDPDKYRVQEVHYSKPQATRRPSQPQRTSHNHTQQLKQQTVHAQRSHKEMQRAQPPQESSRNKAQLRTRSSGDVKPHSSKSKDNTIRRKSTSDVRRRKNGTHGGGHSHQLEPEEHVTKQKKSRSSREKQQIHPQRTHHKQRKQQRSRETSNVLWDKREVEMIENLQRSLDDSGHFNHPQQKQEEASNIIWGKHEVEMIENMQKLLDNSGHFSPSNVIDQSEMDFKRFQQYDGDWDVRDRENRITEYKRNESDDSGSSSDSSSSYESSSESHSETSDDDQRRNECNDDQDMRNRHLLRQRQYMLQQQQKQQQQQQRQPPQRQNQTSASHRSDTRRRSSTSSGSRNSYKERTTRKQHAHSATTYTTEASTVETEILYPPHDYREESRHSEETKQSGVKTEVLSALDAYQKMRDMGGVASSTHSNGKIPLMCHAIRRHSHGDDSQTYHTDIDGQTYITDIDGGPSHHYHYDSSSETGCDNQGDSYEDLFLEEKNTHPVSSSSSKDNEDTGNSTSYTTNTNGNSTPSADDSSTSSQSDDVDSGNESESGSGSESGSESDNSSINRSYSGSSSSEESDPISRGMEIKSNTGGGPRRNPSKKQRSLSIESLHSTDSTAFLGMEEKFSQYNKQDSMRGSQVKTKPIFSQRYSIAEDAEYEEPDDSSLIQKKTQKSMHLDDVFETDDEDEEKSDFGMSLTVSDLEITS